jgi:hypothetical protein
MKLHAVLTLVSVSRGTRHEKKLCKRGEKYAGKTVGVHI